MKGHAQLVSSARTGTGRDDWQTPEVVLERVRRVGAIDLDPCTAPNNPTGAKAHFYLPDHDGLAEPWLAGNGLVYVNPPYSEMKAWAEKIYGEADRRKTPIIALVAARTDTKWWNRLWKTSSACAFWRGRITFLVDGKPVLDKNGKPSPATFPSALLAFNIEPWRLMEAFDDVALIATPY